MNRLAKRAKSIKPSITLAVSAKAKELRSQGVDVIGFGAGEPDFDTPENIKEAAKRALDQGFTKYTPAAGTPSLRQAVCDKMARDQGLEIRPSQVLISCGAKHSLYNIAQALLDPGDEVVIPAPYWVSYPDQVLLQDAVPRIVETREEEGFRLLPDQLREVVGPRTKALILNSPSNPTGCAYSKAELEAIAEVVVEHDLYVISDEIYEKLVYGGFQFHSIAQLGREVRERTIVVNGVSKSHAMTGWRIGWAVGPEELIQAMASIQSQSTSNPTSIAQAAAEEALNGPQEAVETMVRAFAERRDFMVSRLNAMEGVSCVEPQGAFYVFPRMDSYYGRWCGETLIRDSADLCTYLLQHARVACVPGSGFGADAYIRLSYATSMETIREGLERIEGALAELSAA